MPWARQTLFLLLIALLAGCGSSPSTMAPVNYPNLAGNWQIQTASTSTSTPPTQVLLLGELQSSGADVSGTFRFSNLALPPNCILNQVIQLSGTVDGSGDLNLKSTAFSNGSTVKVQLQPSTTATGFDNGTIEVDGGACAAVSSAALGVKVAVVTGTFNGPLIAGSLGSTASAAGTASLVLSQSLASGTDGQFPVTGTLSYTLGTCAGSTTLSGTASGVGVTLAAAVTAPASEPAVSLLGFADPAADKIQAASIDFLVFGCTGTQPSAHVYSGTLLRQ